MVVSPVSEGVCDVWATKVVRTAENKPAYFCRSASVEGHGMNAYEYQHCVNVFLGEFHQCLVVVLHCLLQGCPTRLLT